MEFIVNAESEYEASNALLAPAKNGLGACPIVNCGPVFQGESSLLSI